MNTLLYKNSGAKVSRRAEILRFLFLGGLYLTIFISPFLRGLFFQEELLPILLLIAVSFGLCVSEQFSSWEIGKFGYPLDWVILALVLAYSLSLFNAIHIRDAILELLKVIAYFMVYWTASRAARDEKEMNLFLLITYLSGLGLACMGLGAAAGLIDIAGAYEDGHIRSAMQYHNSLGIYLAALNVVGLGLFLRAKRPLSELFYLGGNFLLAVVILGTLSRGTWLLYLPAMIVLLLVLPRNYRCRAVGSLFIFLGCAVLSARSFFNSLQVEQEPSSLGVIALGLLAVILVYYLYSKLLVLSRQVLIKNKVPKLLVGGISVVLLLLLAYGVFFGGILSHILPANAISRVEASSIESSSVQDRLACYEDAIKIVKDYPLTGVGGGGWKALYHSYASRLYWSSEVHSYYLQTWVEAGTMGFLLLVLAACFFIQLLVKTRIKSREADISSITFWATAVGTVAIGLHAVFDMDFSMAAVGFLFYGFIGAIRGRTAGLYYPDAENTSEKGQAALPAGRNRWIIMGAGAGIMVVLVVFPVSSFFMASIYGERGAIALEARKVEEARILYHKASSLDPFKAAYQVNLAQISAIGALQGQDSQARDTALKHARRATELEPYNEKMHGALYNIFGMLQENEQQVQAARLMLRANPLLAEHYDRLAGAAMDRAWKLLQNKENQKAESYLREIFQLSSDKTPRLQETTPVLDLAAGQSAIMLGEMEKAQKLLSRAAEREDYAYQAKLFLAVACSVAGKEKRAQELLLEISEENVEAMAAYQLILRAVHEVQ